jgi:uncharacterized membrane protein YhaH (DUF805 family)
MQMERKVSGFGHVAKAALAGLLASFVLLASLFAASSSLHRWLHRDGSESSHCCLVCAFVQGQVRTADVASVFALLPLTVVFNVCLVEAASAPSADYRFSPSRAPPQF